ASVVEARLNGRRRVARCQFVAMTIGTRIARWSSSTRLCDATRPSATRTTMKISEIMSKNPRSVSPDTPVSEAARVMKEEDVGLVPVIERVGGAETRGRLVGVVTDRDIAIRHVAEGRASDAPVSDVMSGGV